MNWGFVAGIALIIGLLVARSRLMTWIVTRWDAGRMSERRAKVLLLLVAFGPILIAGVWVAALAPLPWGLLVFLVIIVSLVPSIGIGNAILDYRTREVLKRQPRREDGA